jgi:hypothetical protein
MVTINIQKKDLFLLSAIMIFLIAIGYVVAYNSGGPASTIGHDFLELEGVQAEITAGLLTCAGPNEAIKTINPDTGAVTCESVSGPVTGSIVGGGQESYDSFAGWNCPGSGGPPALWGTAFCTGGFPTRFACPAGSTQRQVAGPFTTATDGFRFYICVQN